MKIVVTAGIHADEAVAMGRSDEILRLRERVHEQAPDVFIVAGDVVGLSKSYLAPTLEALAPPKCLKLIVPGNHDLWLPDALDSYAYCRTILPEVYADCG